MKQSRNQNKTLPINATLLRSERRNLKSQLDRLEDTVRLTRSAIKSQNTLTIKEIKDRLIEIDNKLLSQKPQKKNNNIQFKTSNHFANVPFIFIIRNGFYRSKKYGK